LRNGETLPILTTVEPSFQEIIAAAREGDPTAVSGLWRSLNPDLLRFLRARDQRSADDIASETWIRVGRSVRRFEGSEEDFRAWFFTIARRALIDWHRAESRRASTPVDDAIFDELTADADTAGAAIERLDTEAALRLVALLPPDQAEVIVLRVIAGLDVERVAEIVQKKVGNVRVMQHRGLRRLAAMLERDMQVDPVTP
jgi:RNA polymerase sigma-70 factor (ECF subfamily)